jgi:hypothetical protein
VLLIGLAKNYDEQEVYQYMLGHVNNRNAAYQQIAVSRPSVINLRRDLSVMTVPQNKAELRGRFRHIGYVMAEASVAAQREVRDYGNSLRANLAPAIDYRLARLQEMEVLLQKDNFELQLAGQIHSEVGEKIDVTLNDYLSTKNRFKAAMMYLKNGGYGRLVMSELTQGENEFVRNNYDNLRENNPIALMRFLGHEVTEDADGFELIIRPS